MPLLGSKRHFILLLLIPVSLSVVSANDAGDADALQQRLLMNYNKDIIPGVNYSIPLQINMTFNLVAVKEFDEISQRFSVTGSFTIAWYDERRMWTPSKENHTLFSLVMPVTKSWTPRISIVNPSGDVTSLFKDWFLIRHIFNGTTFSFVTDVYTTVCSVDVTYFPYDVQQCDMYVMVMGYSRQEITLYPLSDKATQLLFAENREWKVIDTSIEMVIFDERIEFLKIAFLLQRRSRFFLVNILLPVVFMGILNLFGFLLPAESGEKVSFSVTVLLATAVFLTIVGDNIPKSSQPISLLSYFLVVQLSLSLFICCVTIINLKIFHTDEKYPVPKVLKSFTARCLCLPCHRRARREYIRRFMDEKRDFEGTTDGNRYDRENNHDTSSRDFTDRKEVDVITWQDVSRAFDHVLGLICTVWLVVAISCCFLLLTTKNGSYQSE